MTGTVAGTRKLPLQCESQSAHGDSSGLNDSAEINTLVISSVGYS
jgi:hypothetical protein